jgi:hypothetical protein
MVTKNSDPLAAALDATQGAVKGNKIDGYFSDRPEVLEAIKRARKDRKLSYAVIANTLSTEADVYVSEGAVKTWLSRNGIA